MKSPAKSVPPADRRADSAVHWPGSSGSLPVALDAVAEVDQHRLALGAGDAERGSGGAR